MTVYLKEEEIWILKETSGINAHKTIWEVSKKLAICKAGKELSLELCQRFDLEPSSFQNYEKINACGLSYSVYAILTS